MDRKFQWWVCLVVGICLSGCATLGPLDPRQREYVQLVVPEGKSQEDYKKDIQECNKGDVFEWSPVGVRYKEAYMALIVGGLIGLWANASIVQKEFSTCMKTKGYGCKFNCGWFK